VRLATIGAAASLAGAVLAAGLRIADPYEHGIWLVAYLVLVGFAAQLLLARGQLALTPEPPSSETVGRQAALWNLGVLAVPLGVLADSRLAVVAGGLALLVALASYARALGGPFASRRIRAHYVALLSVMTASVFVGVGLGWDRPWI
jgi:hypothetical protein